MALGAYATEKYEDHGYLEHVLISRAAARSAASGVVTAIERQRIERQRDLGIHK